MQWWLGPETTTAGSAYGTTPFCFCLVTGLVSRRATVNSDTSLSTYTGSLKITLPTDLRAGSNCVRSETHLSNNVLGKRAHQVTLKTSQKNKSPRVIFSAKRNCGLSIHWCVFHSLSETVQDTTDSHTTAKHTFSATILTVHAHSIQTRLPSLLATFGLR